MQEIIMKKKRNYILLIFCILFTFSLHAQYQAVDDSKILVFTKSNPKVGVKIGASKKFALTNLGTPTSTKKQYSDFDDKEMDVLIYGNSKLYFVDDKFQELEIPDFDNSPLTIGSKDLKIDKTNMHSTITDLYGGRTTNHPISVPRNSIHPHVMTGTKKNDMRLLITYDTREITRRTGGGGPRGGGVEIRFQAVEKIKSIYIAPNN